MGWVMMSERELNRIEVLSQVTQRRMTAVTAANVLGLSRRQVHRLLKTFQLNGAAAIRHKARGRRSNNRIDPMVREFAVTLDRETYIDFGPTFAAEKLAEDHGLKVSRETLRKWMQDAGIWLSRKQRRGFINRGCAVNVLANSSRLMGLIIVGLRIEAPLAPCSSLSTMRPVR